MFEQVENLNFTELFLTEKVKELEEKLLSKDVMLSQVFAIDPSLLRGWDRRNFESLKTQWEKQNAQP